jgi:dipeptidyl aminopeptidase/acylaminoacyl peptidase
VDAARSAGHVEEPAFVADEVWWLELMPAEGGRMSVRRLGAGGEAEHVLPAPWNARNRVHEYGGGSWTAYDGDLVFTEFTDQRLYRMPQGGDPRPLTPAEGGFRFGGISIHGGEVRSGEDAGGAAVGDAVLAIRETHHGEGPSDVSRDIVLVPLDGSAAEDASRIRSLVSGSWFLAQPSFSPDGRRLAWIAWDHPNMPWDGTELRVGDLGRDGRVASWRTVLGGSAESVLQPEWADDDELYAVSDRTGWWNLYRLPAAGGELVAVTALEEDLGAAMWTLTSANSYLVEPAGTLVAVATHGTDRLVRIEPSEASVAEIATPFDVVHLAAERDGALLVVAGSASVATGIRLLHADDRIEDVYVVGADRPGGGYLPDAELMTFRSGERETHAVVYRPKNADFVAPEGELPPFVALVHGGPTSHASPQLSLSIAFWTSRGIGVIDVNYGGSTGYGREYRERLRGQWGVVDVEDTIAAVRGLADAGVADPARLLIRGGSAGGWTVLSALTRSDVFAAGTSYFGVAELTEFAKETHDFESRYLDSLIGALPEAEELYVSRAPLNHIDTLATPVLLLQGLDDPVVPPAQAERFIDGLRSKGVPYAFRFYEGESHGFRRMETKVDSLERELGFYGAVLGFAPPGVPEVELLGG